MNRRIYTQLELDPRLERLAAGPQREAELERFLDELAVADDEFNGPEVRELEAMLRQHQVHVLGRADRF